MSALKNYYKDLFRCNHCGFCQATCRVYKLVLEEDYSARGRLALIRSAVEKKISYSKKYAEILDACLQCKECSVSCPSGVNPAEIILAAREDLVAVRGLHLPKRVIYRNILPNNRMLRFSLQSFRIIRNIILRRFSRIIFRGVDLKNFPVADKPFIGHPMTGTITGNKRKVAFFVGCNTIHLYPEVAEATVRVLHSNGYEVVVPDGLHCCGMPMIIGGDMTMARKLALINLSILSSLDVETVIVACSSCGLALKKEYPRLFAGTDKFLEMESLAGKVKEISGFLSETVELNPRMGNIPWRVTYHDPCHLLRGLGIRQQPRDLLKMVPGLEYFELPEADRCCGGAGMFHISYPELAGQISGRKTENIVKTGATVVATACPLCIYRIQTFADLIVKNVKAMHVVQVLDEAYRRFDQVSALSVNLNTDSVPL